MTAAARARVPRHRGPRIADVGEFGLIDRIARALRPPGDGVIAGIGDDTAVLDTGGPRLLLATVDMQVEGRHFLRARTPPDLLGHRVGAVNLSDIAAMGGTPRWALVSLALPKALSAAWVDGFYRGLDGILAEFGTFVVGGNLSGAGRIVADLTLLGEVERGRVLTRKGARPGDLICVTGTLGRAAAGRAALDAALDGARLESAIRAHLAPTPRVREGQALAATGVVTAMMDISDGLAGDLRHICEASNTDAAIDTTRLPIDPAAFDVAARLGLDPVELALSGGEDFELLFTVAPGGLSAVETALRDGGVTVVGEMHTSADGISINGSPRGMGGWDHFAEGGSRTV